MTKPFLKWVGAKRREAERILPHLKERLEPGGTYWEPFMGSAAVFFALRPKTASLNDIIPELGTTYRALQINASAVSDRLQAYADLGANLEAYLRVRRSRPLDVFDTAARVIYLNRTGFNGLWRKNQKGDFNVPWAKNEKPYFPGPAVLKKAGHLLRRAVITTRQWTVPVLSMTAGDVAFVDPPYPGTYQGYSGLDSEVDEVQLARTMRRKWEQGCHFVMTCPATDRLVPEMEWCDRLPLQRNTTVAQSGADDLRQSMWVSKPR